MQLTARIIYPTADGIAVVIPSGELPLEDVAAKDVPAGVPYRFIDVSDLPATRIFRAAWTADFSSPDGHGIGADAWFKSRAEATKVDASPPETTPEPDDSND